MIKCFLSSGEKIWVTSDLKVSIRCLLWVSVDSEQNEPELLVSGGSDKRLRLWKRKEGEEGEMGGMMSLGEFGVQMDTILALAQNSTFLAAASGQFSPFNLCRYSCTRGNNAGELFTLLTVV